MNRRIWLPTLVLACGLIALIALVVWVATAVSLDEKPNIADLVAAILAATALAVSLLIWARRQVTPQVVTEERLTSAKETLAALVAQQWRTESVIRSLTSDPESIPISWSLTEDTRLMDHPHLIGNVPLTFTGNSQDMPAFTDAFLALRRRRLIITGDAGTGKTTLALQLLLAMTGPGRQPYDPVPVMIQVAGWDTTVYPRLNDWIAVRVEQDYPALRALDFGPGIAKALADRGHLLPILDGLDELPKSSRTAIIAGLNRSLTGHDAFVLTSRTRELATAIAAAGDVLPAAAVIAPEPISPDVAASYLHDCLPRHPKHDWEPLLDKLRTGALPGLAEVTSTALGLWLIHAVYIACDVDPAALRGRLAHKASALRNHLLDRIIDAAITTRPPCDDAATYFRPRRAWDPEQARTYLTFLARLLTTHSTRDLAWWRFGQQALSAEMRQRLSARTALFLGLVPGVVSGITFGLAIGLTQGVGLGLASGVTIGVVVDAACRIPARSSSKRWFDELPGYADLRLRGRVRDLIWKLPAGLTLGLLLALVAGSVAGWAVGPEEVPVAALTSGLTLACGVTFGMWTQQPASSRPASTPYANWKADRTLVLVRTISGGLVLALGVGFVAGFGDGLAGMVPFGGLGAGLIAGLTAALTGGCGFLSVSNHHAWVAYVMTTRHLARNGSVPRDLMGFLDDAHRLGLLRTAGPFYQFRHAELQDRLAAKRKR